WLQDDLINLRTSLEAVDNKKSTASMVCPPSSEQKLQPTERNVLLYLMSFSRLRPAVVFHL
ncbi:MAG: hypothetical protein LOD87_12120, partial [Planifilum fulgidum]